MGMQEAGAGVYSKVSHTAYNTNSDGIFDITADVMKPTV